MKEIIKKIFKNKKIEGKSKIIDNVKSIGIALLIAVIIRSFLIQAFYIPSGSMKPTLLEGDYVFVTKYNYGFSNHSLPFSLPLLPSSRVFYNEPEKGDVVIFKYPGDNSTDYVKRLIGKAGDKIQIINSIVYINGVELKREYIKQEIENGITFDYYKEYIEVAENEYKSYIIREARIYNDRRARFFGPVVVPEDHFFMMGDNRDQSKDSRFRDVGMIPKENLLGKGGFIFFSINGSFIEFWKWFTEIRWNRIFQTIK